MLQLWKPLAIWTLLVWLVLTTIILPATSAMVSWGFIRGDRLLISNEEILRWLFTPSGISFFLLLGGLAIVASIVRFAGIFQIVTCHLKGQPITTRQLAMEILPKLPNLFRLSVYIIALSLTYLVLLASGLAAIYYLFLTGHDINYYLSTTPPDWTRSLILGGIWLLTAGGLFLYLAARFSLALPAFLDCNVTFRKALNNSWEIVGNRSLKILNMIGFTAVLWIILLISTYSLLLAATTFLIDYIPSILSSPGTLASISGVFFLIDQVVKSIIGFLGFSFTSTLITKFYYEDSDLYRFAPPAPGFGQLKSSFADKFNRHFTAPKAFTAVMLFALAGIGFGGYLVYDLPENDTVKILAHRAGPSLAPENTLAALELAIEEGADTAEIDVMRTADGTVVVFHDRDLMRMAGDPQRIENLTYSEIINIVQIPDGGFSEEDRKIATLKLKEMLLRGKDRINFMIELKYYGSDPFLAREVLRVMNETGMINQVSVAAQETDPILELITIEPDLKTGYISAISIGNPARLPVRYVALQHQQVNEAVIKMARENDIEVYAWTVNSPDRIAELINMGVNGIITDHPSAAKNVADKMQELTLAERLLLDIIGWQPAKM